jgi:FG-GAP repeat
MKVKMLFFTSICAVMFILLVHYVITSKTSKAVTTNLRKIAETDSQNIMKSIMEKELEIHYNSDSKKYISPNRKQNLVSYFQPSNWCITPREDETSWKLSMDIIAIGAFTLNTKGNDVAIRTQVNKNKVEFNHDDKFVVVYENKESGVEQTFIVKKQLTDHKQLDVQLKIDDAWQVAKNGNNEIIFAQKNKEAKELKYDKLKSWDATGKVLATSVTVDHNAVILHTDVADAVYPITIDPTLTSVDWQIESNKAGSDFGCSLYAAGDVNSDGYSDIIIGARKFQKDYVDEGAAFLYYGGPSGISSSGAGNSIVSTMPAWSYYGGQAGAQFGASVSTAADVNGDGWGDIIVGAPKFTNGETNEGKVFAFYGAGGDGTNPSPAVAGLATTPNWTAESNQANANFGVSIAPAGDVNNDGYSDIIIGANLYDKGESNEGAVFIYRGKGPKGIAGGLNTIASDTLESNQADANFGISVSSAGDVNGDGYYDVLVGANLYDNGQTDEGAAFCWTFSTVNGFKHTVDRFFEENQAGANFGFSVSTAGDANADGYSDIVVGADLWDNLTNTYIDGSLTLNGVLYKPLTDNGRAFAYNGSSTGLSTTAYWFREGKETNAHFSRILFCAGDVNGDGYSDVVVGAPQYDAYTYTFSASAPGYTATLDFSKSGRVYIYQGSTIGLDELRDLYPGNVNNLELGYAVGPAGDINGDGFSDVIFSSLNYSNGETNEGRVYAAYGKPYGLDNINLDVDATLEKDQASAWYGCSVASAGDVNGDGFGDIIVGAQLYDNTITNEGAAFVYLGSATGPASIPAWSIYGGQNTATLGFSVNGAGDVNGDGYSDVIIGAYQFDQGGLTDNGKVEVYFGSSTGLATSPAWTKYGTVNNEQLGYSVACAGDINLDSYSDIAIGSKQYTNGETNEGRVSVYYGGQPATMFVGSWFYESNTANANLGASVCSAGDVNGDGFNDLLVGAPNYGANGRAMIFYGAQLGLAATPDWTKDGTGASGQFGFSIACTGDINGDAYSDIIIGSPYFTQTSTNRGKAEVFNGGPSGTSATASWTVLGGGANFNFGYSVASAGDVNTDGYSDIIVSMPGDAKGRVNSYHGSRAGLSTTNAWTTTGGASTGAANAQFGYSISNAGDINGDGFSDVITGSPLYTKGQTNEGVTRVYYGGEKQNAPNNLWLLNTDLSTPIDYTNKSENTFGIAYRGRCFLGRSQGRIAWETRKNADSFFRYGGLVMSKYSGQTDRQSSFASMPVTGYTFKQVVLKATLAKTTKTRLRIQYPAVNALTGQILGPWRYLPGYMSGGLGFWSLPLPLKIVDFAALLNNDKVAIKWILENIQNNDKATVEKSIDGVHFEPIDTETLTMANRKEYAYVDEQKTNATKIFYRLKVQDVNGKISYSNVVFIKKNGQDKVTETANSLLIHTEQGFSITTFDAAGAKLYAQQYNGSLKTINKSVITNGKKGAFVVHLVFNNGEKWVRKIVNL